MKASITLPGPLVWMGKRDRRRPDDPLEDEPLVSDEDPEVGRLPRLLAEPTHHREGRLGQRDIVEDRLTEAQQLRAEPETLVRVAMEVAAGEERLGRAVDEIRGQAQLGGQLRLSQTARARGEAFKDGQGAVQRRSAEIALGNGSSGRHILYLRFVALVDKSNPG
jgi:hypothetical protein